MQVSMESNCMLRKALAKRKTLNQRRRKFWKKPGRIDIWWQYLINGILRNEEGKKNLRMPRQVFMKLDLKFYRLLQSKRLPRPPCCFEVILT